MISSIGHYYKKMCLLYSHPAEAQELTNLHFQFLPLFGNLRNFPQRSNWFLFQKLNIELDLKFHISYRIFFKTLTVPCNQRSIDELPQFNNYY